MLKISDISHAYGDTKTLANVSLTLETGAIGCLLGDSGCGKTTLLRCIAGFETLAGGTIEIDGHRYSDSDQHRPPDQRPVGMVFQDFALLPHLSVYDNVAFGVHDRPAADRAQSVDRMLTLVGLTKLAARMPHELSGGQQQRVALARSLVRQPRLLLLDEPFSSLDTTLREQLGYEIRELLRELGTTALFVTHDQREAFSLADQIGVLRSGKLLQWSTAYEIYHKPQSRTVAEFVGGGAWLRGQKVSATEASGVLGKLTGDMPADIPVGSAVDILLRPDDIIHDDDALLVATVVQKHFRGATFLYVLALEDGTKIESLVPSHHDHAVGDAIGIRPDTEHLVAFKADSP
ncbi:MAG: ABC transporter ATP-binding protein [Woeseiaceae bacterium]